MIKGFEKVTYELTDSEKEYAMQIYDILCEHKGLNYTSKNLCIACGLSDSDDNRIRKMIHHLREEELLPDEYIVATNYGYCLTKNIEKINDYIISLKQRISSQLSILDTAVKRVGNSVNDNTCEWILDDEDENSWFCNKCNAQWILHEGNPKDNNMKYCHRCGRKLIYKEDK